MVTFKSEIAAIRELRAIAPGVSLKQAKDFIEAVLNLGAKHHHEQNTPGFVLLLDKGAVLGPTLINRGLKL